MGYKIALDPGTDKTGYCIFLNGVPMRLGCIRPPKTTTWFTDKLLNIKATLEQIFTELHEDDNGPIAEIAVEEFEPGFHARGKGAGVKAAFGSMMKCSCVQGFIFDICLNWSKSVRFASKGKVSQADTELRARAAGLIGKPGIKKPSVDALAAWEIGIAAGFDRKDRK